MTPENPTDPTDPTSHEGPPAPLSSSLALLSRTLDAFGADRSRWPAGREAALTGILATSPEARRLVREAEALDQLLSRAEAATERAAPRSGQLDAIIGAALARRPASPVAGTLDNDGRVVDLAAHRRARATPSDATMPLPAPTGERSHADRIGDAEADREGAAGTLRRALTLLAASLMLGVLVGASDLGSNTMLEFGEALGVASGIESSIAQVDGDGLEELL